LDAPAKPTAPAERGSALSQLKRRLDSQFANTAESFRASLEADTITPVLPGLPSYRGVWYPVYWTPIPGSGERITVLIIAKGEDGQVYMRPTIGDAVLEVAFGKPKAAALRQMLDYVEKTLPDWLASWENAPGHAVCAVPVTGFTLGPAHSSYADNVRQLAAQGTCLEAAFADVEYADFEQVRNVDLERCVYTSSEKTDIGITRK